MATTFRPRTHEQMVQSAEAAVGYAARADADPRVVSFIQELVLSSSTNLLAAVDAHRRAQGAARVGLADLADADAEADEALRQLFGTTKLHSRAGHDALLSLTGGRTMSDYVTLNGMAQVAAVRDLSSRLAGAGDIPGVNEQRLATVVSTNEALARAVAAEEQADGARGVASAAMRAARLAFMSDYRKLIKQLEVHHSAEQIAAILPVFAQYEPPTESPPAGA